jgi:hypothetical protein
MTSRRAFLYLTVVASLVNPALAHGQASQSALAGVARDTTGAVLPGVTVEAASPALIEKVRSVTTDSAGVFRIVDLRPGVYTITFTLPGFNTVRVQDFELRADFTATVNAEMSVGELAETISVTGEAPLVDVQSTTRSAVYDQEVIDNLPNNRQIQSLAQTIPGVASGKSTNTLEVQVAPTAVSYLVNGAVVHATPTRAGTGSYTETDKTHGIVGVRIDDQIELQVDGFELKYPFTPPQRGQ